MSIKLLAAVGLGMLLLEAAAYADGSATCVRRKSVATGRATYRILEAIGRNARSPNAARLAVRISRTRSRLTRNFAISEHGGTCHTTGNAAATEARVDAFVTEILAASGPAACGDGIRGGLETCDGNSDDRCPGRCRPDCTCAPGCGNGIVEGDRNEACDPPCARSGCAVGEICNGFCECVPEVACSCGTPEPTQLRFASTAGSGTCGSTENVTGGTVLDLQCGGLYIGGGGGDLPLPVTAPDNATLVHGVECCNGTSITLGPTTAQDTGSERTCTSPGCFFGGGPLPVINRSLIFGSTCLVNTVPRKSVGAIDCATGDSLIDYRLDVDAHLRGIDFSDEPGWQSCPVCVGGTLGVTASGTCEGGPNDGLTCTPGNTQIDVHHCCIDDPPRNGQTCSDDSDCGTGSCVGGCSAYPTSYDCPPASINSLGIIAVPFELVTGSSSSLTADANGTFCGFCRDVQIEGSNCFDGDPDAGGFAGCPDSVAQPTCRPASGETTGCGAPIRCSGDADCTAPFETCEQKNPGAFRNGTIRSIMAVGVSAGDLTDRLPHPVVRADTFCIEPSFTPTVDAASDLPGPGAILLGGESQLLP